MPNAVQLTQNGQPVYPRTDVSLVVGLQDAIKLPPVKVTTLPTASAETAGKMYYVGPDQNDEYERYITSIGDSDTYDWIDLGDTSIPLPSIADDETTNDSNMAHSAAGGKRLKDEIDQLEQKVDRKMDAVTYDIASVEHQIQDGMIKPDGTGNGNLNWQRFVIPNKGYSSIIADVYGSTSYLAIAFYSDINWGSATLMSTYSVTGIDGEHTYDVKVPIGCRLIIVSNRVSSLPVANIVMRVTDTNRYIMRLSAVEIEASNPKADYRPEIPYTKNKCASIINSALTFQSGSSFSDYKLGKLDISSYIGQTIMISCISKSSDNLYSFVHAFADISDNLVGTGITVTELTNPVEVNVPVGAKWLYITCYIPLNTSEPYVIVKEPVNKVIESESGVDAVIPFSPILAYIGKYCTLSGGNILFQNNRDFRIYEVDGMDEYIGNKCVVDCISKPEDNEYLVGHSFVDGNGDLVGEFFTIKPSQNPITVTIPTGAVKLYLTYYIYGNNGNPKVSIYETASSRDGYANHEDKINTIKENTTPVQWNKKKILWLGTSIPWGQTDEVHPGTTERAENPYPFQVCRAFDATLLDSTSGGLSQQALLDSGTGLWYPKPYGSTCLSVAECTAAYNAGLVSTDLKGLSYENTVLGKNADLYVFDIEPNNTDDGSAEDLANFNWFLWKYNDDSDFAEHRMSYIGGLIYVIDQLLTEKPDAIIVFVGEYIGMTNATYQSEGVRPFTKSLCEKFHFHYIDLAEKLGYNGKSKNSWINTDMIHPKQVTYDRMAKMLIHELMLIA